MLEIILSQARHQRGGRRGYAPPIFVFAPPPIFSCPPRYFFGRKKLVFMGGKNVKICDFGQKKPSDFGKNLCPPDFNFAPPDLAKLATPLF